MFKLLRKKESEHEITAQHIECDLNIGLTFSDVEKRKKDGLINKVSKHVTKSGWNIFKDNVLNIFNILLFAIAILMMIAKLPLINFIFLIIAIANILIGVIQDIRARRLSQKLSVVSYPVVRVLRDGKEIKIESNEIVLSDIILLKNGDQIVTDSTVMEGHLEVNESMLTGESNSISKCVGDTVLSGSYVTSGHAKIRVDQLGKSNYAEKLTSKAKLINKRKSEILQTLNTILRVICTFVICFATILVITYIAMDKFSNEFQKTVASLSGSLIPMLPTGMYLLTSSTLAVGVIQLAKKRMLVHELYCIEMLARVDVLCFDKTGTLTDGSMKVKEVIVKNGFSQKEIEEILHTLVTSTGDKNATANALLDRYKDSGVLAYHSSIAFNSERKFSAVMLNDGRSFALGAREFLPHKDEKIDSLCCSYEKQGFRVMLLCLSKRVLSIEEKLSKLEPVAIVVLEDHIRDDAIENINWFKQNGVSIKIISGDNPISVAAISKQVGVENADKYISLEGMSIEEVKKIANDFTVFGRVSPEQKEALVVGMQACGHKVAMTGDGVNDILALRAADCSIAMASGSDAAQNVSHIVSLDSNFSSLPDVVGQGRRVINNLQRTCSLFLVKTFFAIFLSIFFLIMSFINKNYAFPFETKQLYVWELCTIGLASLFLSFQPNNERLKKSTFFENILTKSIPAGLVQVSIVLVFYGLFFGGVISSDEALLFSTIIFSISSFVVLVRIALPFDKYRLLLIIGLGIVCAGMFIFDIFMPYISNISGQEVSWLIGLNYKLINQSNWWVILVGIICSIPLYIGFETIAILLRNKFSKERGKYENF